MSKIISSKRSGPKYCTVKIYLKLCYWKQRAIMFTLFYTKMDAMNTKKNIYLGTRYRKSTVSEQRGQTMIVD